MKEIFWSIEETEFFKKLNMGKEVKSIGCLKLAARIVDYKERKEMFKFTFNKGEKLCGKNYVF